VSELELARIFNKHDVKDDGLCESVETETMPLVREAAQIPTPEAGAQEPDTRVASAAPAAGKSLGIFSDSRIYSAMIRHELKCHDVTIKHFHHPASFRPERFDLFDSIDAWMVFLSDDYDGPFLRSSLIGMRTDPRSFCSRKASGEGRPGTLTSSWLRTS